jgi:hypothetical protein
LVTRAQLDRLSSRIEALAPRSGTRNAVIFVNVGETEAQAKARHYRDHPEDRDACPFMLFFVAAKNGRPAE